jgi:hypothetical protein
MLNLTLLQSQSPAAMVVRCERKAIGCAGEDMQAWERWHAHADKFRALPGFCRDEYRVLARAAGVD